MQRHKKRYSVWPATMSIWLSSSLTASPMPSCSRRTTGSRSEDPGQAPPSWDLLPHEQQQAASNSNSSVTRPEMEG